MDSLNTITHTASLPLWINWANAVVGIFYGITIIYLLLGEKIKKLLQGTTEKGIIH